MRTNAWVPLIALATATTVCSPSNSSAAVIFSQDFSSAPSGPVSTYVNSSSPNSGQWNAIGSSGAGVAIQVTGGALQYTRAGANAGSFSRTTDFSPSPDALIYRFNLGVSGNTVADTSSATWQVGSGFGTANGVEAAGLTHSKFGINLTATPGIFAFRDISGSANSVNFSGSQSVMWIVNNSGASLSYLAPNGSMAIVANDKWDLWAGTTLALDERNATVGLQSLTDLKFVFDGGSATITMDNFEIQAVPEPTAVALAVFAGALLLFSGTSSARFRSGFGFGRNPRSGGTD